MRCLFRRVYHLGMLRQPDRMSYSNMSIFPQFMTFEYANRSRIEAVHAQAGMIGLVAWRGTCVCPERVRPSCHSIPERVIRCPSAHEGTCLAGDKHPATRHCTSYVISHKRMP